ncbi:MAG TPA: DUF6702 family protein [Gemmatimonadales bacterium]|nr:DUF6702 family protein [Gemmatimonadales bacterium]
MVTVSLAALLALHPLHASTALVEIAAGSGSITLRAFADELPWTGDSVGVASYLETRFLVVSGGRRIAVRFISARDEGDAVVFVLRLDESPPCDNLRIWNGILAERYPDQVNLVQFRCGGRSRQLVFSAGDGAKAP